jgi:ABC-type branched-subunit amino acid transport system ATPase component
MTHGNTVQSQQPLLKAVGVSKHFMGVVALDDVNLEVYSGELVSLIGPNGSGKSTFFNCITGFLRQDRGQVFFKGDDITGRRPDQIAIKGIARTFQDVRVFPRLTVLENLLLVAQQHQEDKLLRRFLHTRDIQQYEAEAIERADRLLDMVGLTRLRDAPGGNLSYGQRKLLEFAAALIPDPDLVMLDEPAAAVNPTMIGRMKHYIRTLNQGGKTFLIVEHNMDVVMDLSHRVVVLDIGRKIAEGSPAEIQRNVDVQEAYFGR